MRLKKRCIICKSNNWRNHFESLVTCNNCGYVRAKDSFFSLTSSKIYKKRYFDEFDYADYSLERRALEHNFIDRLKRIRKYKRNGKLLEIGCAYGFFLNVAKNKFKVSGIDLNEEITRIANKNSGVKIHTGDFLYKHFSENSFDVVCMFDTIEHLKYPDKYINKINKILKPGGLIVIETGDIESIMARVLKNKWRLIKPPFHLQYFSKISLKRLLNMNDFEIKEIAYVSFYRSIIQTFYRLSNNKYFLKFLKPAYSVIFPLNSFDILFVIAKKIDIN